MVAKCCSVLLIMTISMMSLPPSALAVRTMECHSALMKWKTQKGHKAFVVGQHSDYEYCGFSSGQSSKQAAINAAVGACKKIGALECSVHAAE